MPAANACANPARTGAIYRDASRERGITCAATRRSVPVPLVDEAEAAFVGAIRLPENWHAVALQAATSVDVEQRRAARRVALERQLARLQELMYDPDTDLDEWRARKAKVETELATLEHTTPAVDVERAAALLYNLQELWNGTTDEGTAAHGGGPH